MTTLAGAVYVWETGFTETTLVTMLAGTVYVLDDTVTTEAGAV